MLENQSTAPAHSSRSSRPTRRTVPVTALVAFGILATAGLAAVFPTGPASAAVDLSGSADRPAAAVSESPAGAAYLSEISAEARLTLDGARIALADAATVTADITASGLDLGPESITVNTAGLRSSIERLSDLDILPVLFLPSVTDDTAAQSKIVSERVTELRTRLDAALAQKAAEEAAAQAAREAEAAAQAAAAAAAAANTPEGAKATAQQMAAAKYGWGSGQFSCLVSLWDKESDWNYQAYNASSGATGIPQSLPGSKMASAGADWQTNATTQIAWGLDYISRAYGTPCSAWGHSQATGWY